MEFELALLLKELKMRTSKSRFKGIKLLEEKSPEIKNLSEKDLVVLSYLTKAAKLMDDVHFKLENHNNLNFLKFLDSEIKKGNERAELTKKLFMAQKSMFSPDMLGGKIVLAKNIAEPLGMGYFPEDLSQEEFHQILGQMIDDGKQVEVEEILNQRTIVVRDGKSLKAIDFVDAFPEFKQMAKLLKKAIEYSDDEKFNEYLRLQIKALEKADPMLDAEADKVWATLDESKFEFTITRECYDEKLISTIYDNKELLNLLKKHNIRIYSKDSLGARVGIVNKKGTALLKKLKNLMLVAAKFMPYQDEYSQKVSEGNDSQKAVDVDLVTLTGEEGAYQAGIVLAQNLPNDDKPSLGIGGGRRNVYHRQIRKSKNKKLFKNLISDEQFKFYNPEADHWAVICHENTHSLGPNSHGSLGKYSAILEEYKADMGMYAFLDEFVDAGYFSELQAKQIMVTSLSKSFLKGKPELSQAHRVRSVMICNRMLTEKGIELDDDKKLKFDFEKIKKITKQMIAEVVRLQIDADVMKAKEYVEKWFVWTETIETIANIIKTFSKTLNGYLETPLADELLSVNYDMYILKK